MQLAKITARSPDPKTARKLHYRTVLGWLATTQTEKKTLNIIQIRVRARVKVSVCLFYFTYWLSGVFGSILVHHAVLCAGVLEP